MKIHLDLDLRKTHILVRYVNLSLAIISTAFIFALCLLQLHIWKYVSQSSATSWRKTITTYSKSSDCLFFKFLKICKYPNHICIKLKYFKAMGKLKTLNAVEWKKNHSRFAYLIISLCFCIYFMVAIHARVCMYGHYHHANPTVYGHH